MTAPRSDATIETARRTPDLGELREDFLYCVNQRDSKVWKRDQVNADARRCYWPGQTWDGRRWYRGQDDQVFPWEGASDARVPLIDLYIQRDMARLMVTWQLMRLRVVGVESGDAAYSTRMTHFLRWMVYEQMTEARDEAELLANYLLERGKGVMGVFWQRQRQLEYREIDREMLTAQAMAAQQRLTAGADQADDLDLARLPELLDGGTDDARVIELASQFLPDLPRRRWPKVLADLRQDGVARFPYPYLVKDRPALMALAINQDIFLPPEAADIDKQPAVHWREVLPAAELRDRVATGELDRAWVDEVIATQRGRVTAPETVLNRRNRRGGLLTEGQIGRLYEVVHSYRRLSDEEGVPGIYYTCWHPGLAEDYGWHGLMNYQHGGYPFVLFRRELRDRPVDDARGYGEAGFTFQDQLKTEWDQRIDRASIATLPPSYYPPGAAPDKWGPGVKIPTHRPDEYGFLQVPRYDPGSKEAEVTVRQFADTYFGNPTSDLDAQEAQIQRQHLANRWMAGWQRVDTQVLQLCQQFMPEEFWFRVVGTDKGRSIHATRQEIQGRFDLTVSFSTRTLDNEFVAELIGLIEKVLAMDSAARVDRAEALTAIFELLDPNLGERLLVPAEVGAQREAEDERAVVAQIAAGADVDVKPGQAYEIRLRELLQMIQQPDMVQRLGQDEAFRDRVTKRAKQLEHQLEQFTTNAQIGRLGA
jgi:hypothetical protein